jgi:ribonuclease D
MDALARSDVISSPSITLVDTDRALNALLAALHDVEEVAVDTEFHAENRFVPKLMLVQIATRDGAVWVVDAVAVDVSPLARALCGRRMVLHGGRVDVQLLHLRGGVWPRELLDTQRVAALVGRGYPTSLQALALDVLQVHVDKSATLTDWQRRPLTEAQVTYAAIDAAVLFPLLDRLRDDARQLGRGEWLGEVSAEVVEEAERPDPAPWVGWGIVPTLGEPERQVLDRLVRWRALQASAKDRPLHYVLSDGVALDLARRRPSTLEELSANRRIPQGLIHRHADEILFEIAEAARAPAVLPAVPTPSQLRLQRLLQVWAEALENSTKVAATLALPPTLARRVAAEGPGAITGWRRNFLGTSLQRFWDGSSSLRISASDGVIIEPSPLEEKKISPG